MLICYQVWLTVFQGFMFENLLLLMLWWCFLHHGNNPIIIHFNCLLWFVWRFCVELLSAFIFLKKEWISRFFYRFVFVFLVVVGVGVSLWHASLTHLIYGPHILKFQASEREMEDTVLNGCKSYSFTSWATYSQLRSSVGRPTDTPLSVSQEA